MLPILCLFHYTLALIYIFLYLKVKIPIILLSAKEFFAFNVARKNFFSVNLARRLEKLPIPALHRRFLASVSFTKLLSKTARLKITTENILSCLDQGLNHL